MTFSQGHALIIGVAAYPNVQPLPPSVINDARAISHMLQRPDRAGYPATQTRILLDGQATRDGILAGLQWLANSTAETDTALIYFSGHGHYVESGRDAGNYLIPFDAQPHALRRTCIRSDEFTAALSRIRTQKLIVLLDACHSGGSGDVKDLDEAAVKSAVSAELYDELKRGSGRVILASSRPDEKSYVLPGAANSLFTQCLLEALDGEAGHDGEGYIRVFDVVAYVFREVPRRYPKQHPVFKVDMMDENFALALFRGGDKSLAIASPATVLRADDLLQLVEMPPMAPKASVVDIRNFIASRLTLEEMELLCANVQSALEQAGYHVPFDLESVGAKGVSKLLAAQRMVEYLNRRALLQFLVKELNESFRFQSDS